MHHSRVHRALYSTHFRRRSSDPSPQAKEPIPTKDEMERGYLSYHCGHLITRHLSRDALYPTTKLLLCLSLLVCSEVLDGLLCRSHDYQRGCLGSYGYHLHEAAQECSNRPDGADCLLEDGVLSCGGFPFDCEFCVYLITICPVL